MKVVEIFLLAGLGVWFAASTLFALGVGITHPCLRWARRFRAVVAWDVFGANRQRAGRAATYCIQIRDSRGTPGSDWQTEAAGHAAWVWHAWLWQPQRRMADGLRCFAKVIGNSTDETASAATGRRLAEDVVVDYLARTSPLAPGHRREIRLVVTYSYASPVRVECVSLASGSTMSAAPGGSGRAEAERVVVFSRYADDASYR